MWKKLLYIAFIIWMSAPIQSAVLECDWSQQYCTPISITPVTKPNEVITISGKPSDFVDPTTTSLIFSNMVFNYIPSGLFNIFPNLGSLELNHCGITTLTTDSIPSCGVLNIFTLIGGTFTNIPAGVLQSCTKLTSVGIVFTDATIVDVDALRGLTNLNNIGITNSKISCLPLGLFQHTPNIMFVNIYSNMITSIDSNLFANLPVLSTISLRLNLITYVPVLNLTGSPVSVIELGSNPINALAPDFCSTFETRPPDSFDIIFSRSTCIPGTSSANTVRFSTCQTYSTEYQNCYNNWTPSMNTPVSCPIALPPTTMAPTTEVVTIEPTTLSPTPGSCPSDKICRYFLDQYNRYTCILDGVDSVLTSISGNHLITFTDVDVRRIVFTNSFLSRIPSILFQKFANLEYLEAPNCSISVMNTNTFTECGNLRYFDVGYNLFTTVDGASLKSCAALEVVDLTGNKIDFISGQLFVNNPTLKTVYINKPPVIVLV